MDISDIHKISRDHKCSNPYCDRALSAAQEELKPHDAGWQVNGYDELQWVSFKCSGCGHITSLDKLGVPRP